MIVFSIIKIDKSKNKLSKNNLFFYLIVVAMIVILGVAILSEYLESKFFDNLFPIISFGTLGLVILFLLLRVLFFRPSFNGLLKIQRGKVIIHFYENSEEIELLPNTINKIILHYNSYKGEFKYLGITFFVYDGTENHIELNCKVQDYIFRFRSNNSNDFKNLSVLIRYWEKQYGTETTIYNKGKEI